MKRNINYGEEIKEVEKVSSTYDLPRLQQINPTSLFNTINRTHKKKKKKMVKKFFYSFPGTS